MSTPRAGIAALLALAPACSLGTYKVTECSENTECRDVFGLGSVCGDEGYCETAELNGRCETSFPEGLSLPIDPESTFVFATLLDHTIDTQVARYQSAELAAAQVNDNGGLDGRGFTVLHCSTEEGHPYDGLDKDTAAVETALWLADTLGVAAIVGPSASSRTEAVYNAIADLDTLLISPSATSPTLTDLDGIVASDAEPGLLWRTAPPDSLQGRAIADDMLARGVGDVAVIHQTGAYGEGLSSVFADIFAAGGGEATLFPFDSETARSEATSDVSQGSYDEVLFIASDIADITSFLNTAASQSGFEGVRIFLADGARTTEVLDQTNAARDLYPLIRGTAPALPEGPVYDSFTAGYTGRYNDDVSQYSYTAQSFDAGWLVIYGTAWAFHQEAGEITGTHVARGLRKVSNGEEFPLRPSSWNSVSARFADGLSVDVEGASGPLDYDSVTEETSAPVDYWVINGEGDGFIVDGQWP